MLKVVVFDGGWGGELVANYLSQELQTIEVVRVIDWYNAPYDNKTLQEIADIAQELLSQFIGKVDLIVLGGFTASTALEVLQERFPEQKFVGMPISYDTIPLPKHRLSHVVVLANEVLLETSFWEEMKENLPCSTLILPDSSGWEDLINIGEMSVNILRRELQTHFRLCVTYPAPAPATAINTPAVAGLRISSGLRSKIKSFLALSMPMPQLEFAVAGVDSPFSIHGAVPYFSTSRLSSLYRRLRLRYGRRIKADAVVVANTHFWAVEDELAEVFGSTVPIVDFREQLLHDVCLALGLRGVDGKLGRRQG